MGKAGALLSPIYPMQRQPPHSLTTQGEQEATLEDRIMDAVYENTVSGLLRPARTETFEHRGTITQRQLCVSSLVRLLHKAASIPPILSAEDIGVLSNMRTMRSMGSGSV
jgi:hypothetical protein